MAQTRESVINGVTLNVPEQFAGIIPVPYLGVGPGGLVPSPTRIARPKRLGFFASFSHRIPWAHLCPESVKANFGADT